MADKRRRKSLKIFWQRSETPPLAPVTTTSLIESGPSSPVEKRTDADFCVTPIEFDNTSPKARPRALQKHRTSVFGSLRSLHSLDEEEKLILTRSDSKASSLHDDAWSPGKNVLGDNVRQYGEVQTPASTMFRKRTQFLVLTESHLIRFKSQIKAAEMFPSIPSGMGRIPVSRGSVSSAGSYTEIQMTMYSDITQGIPLDQIVAVYKLEDGRPFFTIEVAYIDERGKRGSAVQLQFNEPREAERWTCSIRTVAAEARKVSNRRISDKVLSHVAMALERERDYDPLHFRVFKVVQRSSLRAANRSSSEDLAKNNISICYLAVGVNKLHFVPVPRTSTRSSATSLNEVESPSSYGITTLSAIKLQRDVDSFQIILKRPFRNPYLASLASCEAAEIVLWLRFASEYLRPEWTVQPFVFDVPAELDEQLDPPNFPVEDYNCFDRTLIAFCSAFDVDTSRIYYSVDEDCEDAPCFRLMSPPAGVGYSPLELLAVLRALRYNESFASISFANIDLRALRDLYDTKSVDADDLCTRSGHIVHLPEHSNLPVLSQELRALAIKSRRLRRLDFSHAMSRPSNARDERLNCGIPEALTPLCKKSLTNVDWIVLTGILLGDSDLNFLVDAASERQCHLRALEIGESGLSIHDIDVLLSTLVIHDSTMEVIDISGAQGRFSPELFQRLIGSFSRIRRLNLTRVQKTAGPEPLIAPETLFGWRLESLHLSQTALNEQSVDTLSAYLASPKSDTLRDLQINQCGLTGKDLAIFFESMTRANGEVRKMHVNASENRLGIGCSLLSKSIAESHAPASLTMRMMDFEKESHFRELIKALATNKTIRSLDISRASLPYDASTETCEALKEMFSSNDTLEELDISGEHAHLDAARFGIGLNLALLGLQNNVTLRLLRIEHQSLGLQGANTLAGVLEENSSLLEIHCEHNDINLQSFTVLVNALKKNKTLLYLPNLDLDKERSMIKVKEEFEKMDKVDESKSARTGALKKSINAFSHKGVKHHRNSSSISAHSTISFTENDVSATLRALDEKWNIQVGRLQQYLMRNHSLAIGAPWKEMDEGDSDFEEGRPGTAESLGKLLGRMKMDQTPTVERDSPLTKLGEKLTERAPPIFQLPED